MLQTQSDGETHNSATLSILPRTAAPFQARTRGSTSLGGGMICTFSIFGTKGVAMACNLHPTMTWLHKRNNEFPHLLSSAWAMPGINAVPPMTRTA